MVEKDGRPEADVRWKLLVDWDDELLHGGVTISEWSTLLVQDADLAFCAGADLAALLAAQAAMESHLRYEYGAPVGGGFAKLIDSSPLPDALRVRLHEVRRLRNAWVHVRDPEADDDLVERSDVHRSELSAAATRAMRLLREILYLEQCL
jgi:hypothetical protein